MLRSLRFGVIQLVWSPADCGHGGTEQPSLWVVTWAFMLGMTGNGLVLCFIANGNGLNVEENRLPSNFGPTLLYACVRQLCLWFPVPGVSLRIFTPNETISPFEPSCSHLCHVTGIFVPKYIFLPWLELCLLMSDDARHQWLVCYTARVSKRGYKCRDCSCLRQTIHCVSNRTSSLNSSSIHHLLAASRTSHHACKGRSCSHSWPFRLCRCLTERHERD